MNKRPSIATVIHNNGGIKKKDVILIKLEKDEIKNWYKWANRYVSDAHGTNFMLIETYEQLEGSCKDVHDQNIFIDWSEISKDVRRQQTPQQVVSMELNANTMLVMLTITHRQKNNHIIIATFESDSIRIMEKVLQNIDHTYQKN